MAIYPIQELKNLITDRIHDNHERAIDGIELQELLHDILDSLESYTDESMEAPAVNYYVNQILWDIATGALTLVRAGGIDPANISVDLDGRYQKISDSDYRNDEVSVEAGEQPVEFNDPFPEGVTGDDYTIPLLSGKTAGEFWLDFEAYDKTRTGFKVNADEAVTFPYTATLKK
jgi:hypothetical protein